MNNKRFLPVINEVMQRKGRTTPRQGIEPWSPPVTGGDVIHYTNED